MLRLSRKTCFGSKKIVLLLRPILQLHFPPRKQAMLTPKSTQNVYAAIFLIPLGVCVYVVLGGLRATFLCKAPRKHPRVPMLT